MLTLHWQQQRSEQQQQQRQQQSSLRAGLPSFDVSHQQQHTDGHHENILGCSPQHPRPLPANPTALLRHPGTRLTPVLCHKLPPLSASAAPPEGQGVQRAWKERSPWQHRRSSPRSTAQTLRRQHTRAAHVLDDRSWQQQTVGYSEESSFAEPTKPRRVRRNVATGLPSATHTQQQQHEVWLITHTCGWLADT